MEPIGFGNVKKNTPNGIEFSDGGRALYFQGKRIADGALREDISPRDYFYGLRFLDDFPQVASWAFGDAWTQRIMVRRPKRDSMDSMWGEVYFGDEENRGMYVIERAYDPYPPRPIDVGEDYLFPPWVQTPLPPRFNVTLNIPLQLVVARAVLSALDDNFPYEQWQFVTSVVEREHVPQVIVEDIALAYRFRIKALPLNLRLALCDLQSIGA